MSRQHIKAIKRDELDLKAYDDCISRASPSKIYARSWYLDAMCDDWYVLVLRDYEAVMPLPMRRKFGFSYIYQPFMVQQLGVFPSTDQDEQFYQEAISRHLHIHYTFHQSSPSILHHSMLVNLVLPLTGEMEEMKKRFSSNRKRDLKKSTNEHLTMQHLDKWDKIEPLIADALISSPYRDAMVQLQQLFLIKKQSGQLHAEAVMLDDACIFLVFYGLDAGRIYYLLPLTLSPKAKELGVATWVIVQLIQRYIGEYTSFDFEGSAVPGVRRFYESFGSEIEPYYHIKKTFFQFMKHASTSR